MHARTVYRRSTAADILRGILVSIAATALLVVVFALILSFVNLSDSVVHAVNQLIKLAAVYAGVHTAVRPGDKQGLIRGVIVGAVYMAAGVAVYAALTAQHITFSAWAADVLMGIAAGGIMGLLRARK